MKRATREEILRVAGIQAGRLAVILERLVIVLLIDLYQSKILIKVIQGRVLLELILGNHCRDLAILDELYRPVTVVCSFRSVRVAPRPELILAYRVGQQIEVIQRIGILGKSFIAQL